MKIKTKALPYEKVMAKKRAMHRNPLRPMMLLHALIRILAIPDLWRVKFRYERENFKSLKDGPYLILMNHSSFIDLKIASKIFFPKRYNIVCTTDALVGKEWLMRLIGCIPTRKFVSDLRLMKDIAYALQEKKTSVLLYPEAGYSFDGRTTPLPQRTGLLVKKLGVPVLMVETKGAFAHDPLYNGLQLRKVQVTATVKELFSRNDLETLTPAEMDTRIDEAFSFDQFAWQYENGVEIKEDFRADGLERILYKCASCGTEGEMVGKGIHLICKHCGKQYELLTNGRLEAKTGETEFPHIPDWYRWERGCVKKEIEEGTYSLDTDVEIGMIVDYKALYMVGSGRLTHGKDGFHLTGCDGKLDYSQSPKASYCLNSDYFWYEIDDMISIGNSDVLYYCFPKKKGVVTKTRLATEELYKMVKPKRKEKTE